MLVVMGILSAILLGFIIYFAFSPKSSRILKITAIVALGLIGLSIGVCCVFIIIGPSKDPQAIELPVFQDTPTVKAGNDDTVIMIILLIILVLTMGALFAAARRSQKNHLEAIKSPANKSPVFMESDDLDMGLDDEPAKKEDDDSFDLDLG